ncbi:CrcB family protein [Parvularcula sp. LCG005]|uniref:fluoride efflux transporter FluC n=1 Tax=Parvularcula sp. LCG005 TaxID=3078805 RepID=UPI0029433312|nr:CrcB family protein [Parvularcula sp. LCG005]WOI52486.1 CrcB family protein [Parvularcula sp. LCG005]
MKPLFLLAIALGGAIGAVARYLSIRALSGWHGAEAAWSTLGVNVVGSFLLGLAAAVLAGRGGTMPPFVMVGLLGAFTTFSTFALDAVWFYEQRGLSLAALYVGLSVVLAIAAFVIGTGAGKALS